MDADDSWSRRKLADVRSFVRKVSERLGEDFCPAPGYGNLYPGETVLYRGCSDPSGISASELRRMPYDIGAVSVQAGNIYAGTCCTSEQLESFLIAKLKAKLPEIPEGERMIKLSLEIEHSGIARQAR